MAIILVQGPEEILAERAIAIEIEKIRNKDDQAVVSKFSADEIEPGMISDALAPSLLDRKTHV